MARTSCPAASAPSPGPQRGHGFAELLLWGPKAPQAALLPQRSRQESGFLPRPALPPPSPHPAFPPLFLAKALLSLFLRQSPPRRCPSNRPKQGILSDPQSRCLNPRQEYCVKSLPSSHTPGTPLSLKYQQSRDSSPCRGTHSERDLQGHLSTLQRAFQNKFFTLQQRLLY